MSSKGSTPNGVYNDNNGSSIGGDGFFHRGGFRASAGSRYSDWMGGVGGGSSVGAGSSATQSQSSSFAPLH